MRLLVFTKPFGAVQPGRLAEMVAATGADGADLVVRDGQSVTPGTAALLPVAARELAAAGVPLELVSTDFLTAPLPASPRASSEVERVFGACAEAGVTLVRVGFYPYDPARGYRACLDDARRGLASLAALAARFGLRPLLQLHHQTIHPSAALALRLVDGLDVGVYADPGNQTKEGAEDWRMSLDLLGDRLAAMGVKNSAWNGSRVDWQPFADGGVVPWPEITRGLRERAFSGPLSLHVHYPSDDPVAAVTRDLAHLRGLVVEV
ncbi:MAG: sugar phosphate isomerase/epimerase [Thermoactinospora sp.]|nr:sugar phosphate isomerase/epimerase [Thermoactinospora sp.]